MNLDTQLLPPTKQPLEVNTPLTELGHRIPQPDWEKYTLCQCVWHNSVIAPRTSVGVRHRMACAKLDASGPPNSWRTSPVEPAQKGQQNDHTTQKRSPKLEKLVKKVKKLPK